MNANKIRVSLLTFTCGAVFLTLGSVIVRSPNYEQAIKNFPFPQRVSLPEWEQVSGVKQLGEVEADSEIINQKAYKYKVNNLALDIEMRYSTQINVRSLVHKYQQPDKPAQIRQRSDIGYYGMGFHKGRVYLSACITPQGDSTYTYEQFRASEKYVSNLDIKHIINWILGRERLREEKCLWNHLSMSVDKDSPKKTYQLLENVWFEWYKIWRNKVVDK